MNKVKLSRTRWHLRQEHTEPRPYDIIMRQCENIEDKSLVIFSLMLHGKDASVHDWLRKRVRFSGNAILEDNAEAHLSIPVRTLGSIPTHWQFCKKWTRNE